MNSYALKISLRDKQPLKTGYITLLKSFPHKPGPWINRISGPQGCFVSTWAFSKMATRPSLSTN